MIANSHDDTQPDLPAIEDELSQTCLLLVDIGNTQVAMATWVDGQRSEAEHLPCEPFEPVILCCVPRLWLTRASAAWAADFHSTRTHWHKFPAPCTIRETGLCGGRCFVVDGS